jgi:hypothetical protein
MPLIPVNVLIDDSSDRTILGVWSFDRTNGGILKMPFGTAFPSPTEADEFFWRSDESKLYKRNSANTAWDAVEAAVALHGSTHENGGADEIDVGGLSGVLADDQPAQAHAIGGTKHTASTLAQLNALISDATLDDQGDPRTDDDAIHDNVAGEISVITEKTAPVAADLLLLEDSAASNAKKRVQIGNLPGISAIETDEVTSFTSTTSATFIQLTGSSITFTPKAGERVLVFVSMTVANTVASGSNRQCIDVSHNNSGSYVREGGTRGLQFVEAVAADWDCPIAFACAVELPNAVSTTFRIEWRREGTGTMYSRGADCPIRLQVVRF